MPLYQCSPAAYAGFLNYFNKSSVDGWMSRNELKAAYSRLGMNPNSMELQQIIDLVSVNAKGINWQCFIDFVVSYQQLRDVENEYRDAFRIYDVSGQGVLKREDIKYVMSKLGIQVDMDSLMDRVDTNRDGTIDYDEFVTMMQMNVM